LREDVELIEGVYGELNAQDYLAGKVAPFYWVDAPRVLVWLCRECASELHMSEAPRAILQGARR